MKPSIALKVPDLDTLVSSALKIESAGLGAWTTEQPGWDAVLRAAHIAARTTTLELGTSTAYMFTRHPLATAAQAIEMDALSGGRFRLGLGTGHRTHWNWYGVDFSHAASRLEEYVAVMRAAFTARDHIAHHGRYFDIDLPVLAGPASTRDPEQIRILGSGLNAAMLRAVGRSCDGILLHPLAMFEPFLDDVVLPALDAGTAHGRPFVKIGGCITVLDQDGAEARRRARRQLGFYLAQPAFGVVTEDSPWHDFVMDLRTTVSEHGLGGLAAAAAAIPDDLLDSCAVAGTADEARDRIVAVTARLSERGFDEIVFAPVYEELSAEETLSMVDALSGALALSVDSPPRAATG